MDLNVAAGIGIVFTWVSLREKGVDLNIVPACILCKMYVSLREKGVDLNILRRMMALYQPRLPS